MNPTKMLPFANKLYSAANRLLPLLPGRYHLSVLVKTYGLVSANEREAYHLEKIGPCSGTAIDIGANFGLYSLQMSRLYDKVIAFEPNADVAAPLITARLQNLTLIHEGISNKSGEARLFIPISNGVTLGGWASLDEHNCPEATDFHKIVIPLSPLDSHHLGDVGLIKIDVEGHELQVLQGAEQTIRRSRPHLIIEVRDEHVAEVRATLAGWGYGERTLQELAGVQGSAQNYIFIPLAQK
jgi:FkbM family methyltransferase